jgi:hypothetical protein
MHLRLRQRRGYTIRRNEYGERTIYVFNHARIERGGAKGVWQFEQSYYRGKRVPHIFFTCPLCGDINKDYLSLRTILERVRRSNPTIRYCHNCRFCRKQVPYTLREDLGRIRREYQKAEKLA